MINLYVKGAGQPPVGVLTPEQLQFLIDNLVEEYIEDQDYAITPMTIEFLRGQGGDRELIELLQRVLAGREEVILRWE